MTTQGDWLTAFQVHSRERPTFTVPVPPDGPNEVVELVRLGWQRTPPGPVTLVVFVDELPHAAAAATVLAKTNR